MQSFTKLGNWEIALNPEYPVSLARQVHGNMIVHATSCEHAVIQADGVTGTQFDGAFGVHTADCLPLVVITDTQAAVLHISRHTLVAGILDTLTELLGKEPIRTAYIGQHICENCFVFEEKGEGIAQFEKLFPYAVKHNSSGTHLSLRSVILHYLKDIPSITEDSRCTFETQELPSYRRWRKEGSVGDFPRMVTSVRFMRS